jgi:lipopolysaccharide export system ATP-binding protein
VSEAVLRAVGLVKSYQRRRVVDGVAFHVRPGEVVGLLGPNGAGKTTSFNMVVGLVAPDAGRVLLGDEDLTRLPMHRRARRGVGYLPQEASIFRKLTVRENFTAVLEALGVGRAERARRAEALGVAHAPRPPPTEALLEEFRLEPVAESRGESLSGGERRRAEVARSLLSSPRHILFDEPFAGVDPIAVAELQRLIGALRDRGLGVLLTDHNVREALGICDRAYVLSSGTLLEEGTPAEIAASSRARAAYLGESFRLDAQQPLAGQPSHPSSRQGVLPR